MKYLKLTPFSQMKKRESNMTTWDIPHTKPITVRLTQTPAPAQRTATAGPVPRDRNQRKKGRLKRVSGLPSGWIWRKPSPRVQRPSLTLNESLVLNAGENSRTFLPWNVPTAKGPDGKYNT